MSQKDCVLWMSDLTTQTMCYNTHTDAVTCKDLLFGKALCAVLGTAQCWSQQSNLVDS